MFKLRRKRRRRRSAMRLNRPLKLYTARTKPRRRRGNRYFNPRPFLTWGGLALGIALFAFLVPKIFSNPFKQVVIADGYGEYTLLTKAKNVGEIYQSGVLNMKESDSTLSFDTPVTDKMVITVDRSIVVNVISGGTNVKVRTPSGTAREILIRAGVPFEESDSFNVSLDEIMKNGDTIVHAMMETKTITRRVPIEYDTVRVDDNSLAKGKTEVITAGENGYKNVSYLVTYQDGVEIDRVKSSEKVIKEPVNRKVAVGTKTATTGSSGKSSSSSSGKSSSRSASSYQRSGSKPVAVVSSPKDLDPQRIKTTKTVTITAYTHDGSLTATGATPGIGTVAVDPRQIPLGTKLYIPGYGFGIAQDTGGAIKGNIIDIFLDSEEECRAWGRKFNRTIYILKY